MEERDTGIRQQHSSGDTGPGAAHTPGVAAGEEHEGTVKPYSCSSSDSPHHQCSAVPAARGCTGH